MYLFFNLAKNKNIHINKKLGFRFIARSEIKDPEWDIMDKSK